MSGDRSAVTTWLRVLAAAVAGVLALAGCAGREKTASSAEIEVENDVTRPLAATHTVIRGGSPRQRVLLRSIVAGLAESDIRRLSIHRAESGWRPSSKLGAYGRTWLTLRVGSNRIGSEYVRSSWIAALIAGAFRDQSHALSLPDILGYTPVLDSPLGTTSANGQLIGGKRDHKIGGSDSSAVAAAAKRKLRVAARASGGFDRVRLSFLKPLQFALVADITARSPKRAAQFFYRNRPFKSLEGTLILLRDRSGRPTFAQAAATRANYGALWTREG